MPAAAAAFSIGTAKPMPMKVRCSVGLQDRGDDADHLAVHRDQRAARVARVGGGVELDQVGQHALALGRAELALQAGDDAGRHRRADAEREADRDHLVAGRRSPVRAHRRGDRSSGMRRARSTARSFSGCGADHGGVGLEAVGEGDLDALGAAHDVQVGQDGAVVDDDDAGADAALVRRPRSATWSLLLRAPSGRPSIGSSACGRVRRPRRSSSLEWPMTRTTEPTHRRVGLGRRRRQRLLLERMAHRRVDVCCVSGWGGVERRPATRQRAQASAATSSHSTRCGAAARQRGAQLGRPARWRAAAASGGGRGGWTACRGHGRGGGARPATGTAVKRSLLHRHDPSAHGRPRA